MTILSTKNEMTKDEVQKQIDLKTKELSGASCPENSKAIKDELLKLKKLLKRLESPRNHRMIL